MWLIFGTCAIITALLNIMNFKKRANIFRFLSLSFTSLTVCAFYADGAGRVVREDWSGLMDTMPTISKALWICVALSILINSISLIKSHRKKLQN
ncbi:hypothetical protein [Anaerococcus degeneri]|uniref:MFS transporter n=1 Tax=Anaerococcus degeneri TaxID=361500 RepID=A0ABS7YZB3_9FIRM|nr:hypothetical protein [Anaerococcus degeneri]MBP2014784.1 hypothetical protein [Anaerococcus degeneri]MCA2096993.1 hypothetical protein [Anaerococcus degeneri]